MLVLPHITSPQPWPRPPQHIHAIKSMSSQPLGFTHMESTSKSWCDHRDGPWIPWDTADEQWGPRAQSLLSHNPTPPGFYRCG